MEIKRDKKQFDWYLGNKGIIGTHLRYLDWLASEERNKGHGEGGGRDERCEDVREDYHRACGHSGM